MQAAAKDRSASHNSSDTRKHMCSTEPERSFSSHAKGSLPMPLAASALTLQQVYTCSRLVSSHADTHDPRSRLLIKVSWHQCSRC